METKPHAGNKTTVIILDVNVAVTPVKLADKARHYQFALFPRATTSTSKQTSFGIHVFEPSKILLKLTIKSLFV